MAKTDSKKAKNDDVLEILSRGVEQVTVREHVEARLKKGEKLRVKLGIDPTSPHIHLGRVTQLLKLKDFQDAGHKVVLIVGDFTGEVGDTSDKESERPMLSPKQIKANMKQYLAQASRFINIKKAEVHYNSTWLAKLKFGEVARLADAFSVAEFSARSNIKKRLEEGKRVSLREMLYPLMQGYDSVKVKADIEIGGVDQTFNLLAGRNLQSALGLPAQDIMTGPLIPGTDGRKMSSSWGNTITLEDKPEDVYGKVMKIPDDIIVQYFISATRMPLSRVNEIAHQLEGGANPRDAKMELARAVTTLFYNAASAQKAEHTFVSLFQKHESPTTIPSMRVAFLGILDVLVETGLASSKSEARRLMREGGIKRNGVVERGEALTLKNGDVMSRGKRQFVRIIHS